MSHAVEDTGVGFMQHGKRWEAEVTSWTSINQVAETVKLRGSVCPGPAPDDIPNHRAFGEDHTAVREERVQALVAKMWNGIHIAALPDQIEAKDFACCHLAGLSETSMRVTVHIHNARIEQVAGPNVRVFVGEFRGVRRREQR